VSFTLTPRVAPPLDPDFQPGALFNHAFLSAVEKSGKGVPLVIGLERGDGSRSVFSTRALPPDHPSAEANLLYADRLVKTLLWQRGAHRVVVGGPPDIGEYLRREYSPTGARAFDAKLMAGVYEQPFVVEVTDAAGVPPAHEQSAPIGRHLDGCRIGFDLGASDRKVSAVMDGQTVFSEEVVWDPRRQSDPSYHYHEIMSALHRAAAHLPRVDAIGGSAAGIYINSRVMVASLFRGIPQDLFDRRVKDLFLQLGREWKVPFVIANDGDVTALAGSMSLNANSVLGLALGSSEAGGYVDAQGNITGWLNELAFVPVDFGPGAPVDEWSGDRGCGSLYFSQQAIPRLAAAAGISLDEGLGLPEKLEAVQDLMAGGHPRAEQVFATIGCHLGYGLAYYADFYHLEHVLILGRVTSGQGGQVILDQARRVLREEFPDLASSISVNLPDERSRRVGQAVAAASLPAL